MTSIKTATVNVRIQESIKVEAEAILKKLGLTRATAIDLFYRQIIMHNGIPFPLEIKKDDPKDKKRWRKIIQVEKLLNREGMKNGIIKLGYLSFRIKLFWVYLFSYYKLKRWRDVRITKKYWV